MRDAVLEAVFLGRADALVMAAAVADFRPTSAATTKLSRDAGLTIELEPTEDILAEVGARAGELDPRPVIVGFAAETGSLDRAPDKLRRKGADLLVANDVAEAGSGFGTDTNRVSILGADGSRDDLPLLTEARGRGPAAGPGRALLDEREARGQTEPPAWRAAHERQTESTRRLSVVDIAKLYADGTRIATITAYDFPTAALVDEAGVPLILVGDSLAQVMLGYDTTVRVTMDEMLHHTKAVVRGTKRALIVGDMPFLSYTTPDEAVAQRRPVPARGRHAGGQGRGRRAQRAGIEAIVKAGIPVMGHIGLTPQAINAIGKVRVQGKSSEQARALLADALAVQEAGAFAVVLELVPAQLAAAITERLRIPTIGIGAGAGCSGQIQVITDTARLGRLDAEARAQVRGPPRDDPRGDQVVPADVEAGSFPGEAETVLMDPAVLDEVLGRSADDVAAPGSPVHRRDPARPRPLEARGALAGRSDPRGPARGPRRRAPGRSASCRRWAGSTPATSPSSSARGPTARRSSSRSSSTRASSGSARTSRSTRATRRATSRACEAAGVDIVFAPSVDEVYPPGFDTVVSVGAIAAPLEGAARPGHFDGVATVVAILFALVGAERAYFGPRTTSRSR